MSCPRKICGGMLLISLLFSSCATPRALLPSNQAPPQEGFSVYQTVPLTKSLLASPQFKVIDDFTGAIRKNRLGAAWRVRAGRVGQIRFDIDKNDARGHYRGLSMKVAYHLERAESGGVKTSLKQIDMSHAQFFALKCHLKPDKEPFNGRLRVTLTDWKNQSVTHDITEKCIDPVHQWGEAVIPMAVFNRLDLDQLSSFDVSVVARDSSLKGFLWIDEIAFWGENDVEFESHRDNLIGFPKTVYQTKRQAQLRLLYGLSRALFLKEIARDTWKYFENARDRDSGLVVDHLRLGDAPLAANYTSPTNVAIDILAHVAAMELGFIPRAVAGERVRKILTTLHGLPRWEGFFYNFYDTSKLTVTRDFVSTVDSGWLAIALVVARQSFDRDIAMQASALLEEFNFNKFLDPENNQLSIGYDGQKKGLVPNHYGLLATEARATSFYGIGKGDLPRDHWWFLYRTPPAAWRWQTQAPHGKMVEIENVDVFEGYYMKDRKKFLPSWGGSLFEFLMPTLVLKEQDLAPKGLGLNNRIATELHRDYALREKKYPVWGISPAATASGRQWRYEEFGVTALGAKGYPDKGVVTPHVSFLALETLPKDALANIRKLLNYDIYGEYGFYDSLNLRRSLANPQYLALDQGMILIAICNYIKNGVIQNRFHADPVAKKAEDLIVKESFFTS